MKWFIFWLGWAVAVAIAHDNFLAIAILSSISNSEHRQAIRESWLSIKQFGVKVAFIVGHSHSKKANDRIAEEARVYKDILAIKGHPESYRGIVEKTKVAFRWAFEGDEPFKFLLKCDDDSYVHLESLLEQLRQYVQSDPLHSHYYMGDFRVGTNAIRDPESKYFVSHQNWQNRVYPMFAVGCGYVIGSAVGKELIYSGLMEFSVPIEDVSVGIWMDQLAHQSNFTVGYKIDLRFVPAKSMGWQKGDFVWHELTPKDMRDTWEKYQNKIDI